MKKLYSLFFTLFVLLALVISCKSRCDCSYETYKKIRKGMNRAQVGEILFIKPSKEKTDGAWLISTYQCDEDFIVVIYNTDRIVEEIAFNTIIN